MRIGLKIEIPAIVLALAVSGCGGGAAEDGAAPPLPDALPASAFPAAAEIPPVDTANLDAFTQELVVLPSGEMYEPGKGRFGFAVFDVFGEQIVDADAALYLAPRSGGDAIGPFPSRVETIEVEAPFRSETSAADPDAPEAVYVSEVRFPAAGKWDPVAAIREGEEFTMARLPTVIAKETDIPAEGERAPGVSTPTVEDVGAISEIETRSPPDTMHTENLADVLGREPAVLLFAAPALCTSRVCGPVVDVAEQVKSDLGDKASFIHMEIWQDNDPSKPPREQVSDYDLRSEPWLFVIDRDGVIDTRIEGAFGVGELERAIERVSGSAAPGKQS